MLCGNREFVILYSSRKKERKKESIKGNKLQLHEVLKNGYRKNKKTHLRGYHLDQELSDHNKQVYYNPANRQAVYNVTGTHNLSDVGTDFYLLGGHLKDTSRYKKAHRGLRAAKAKYGPDVNVTITGHSLGGSIAGYIGDENDGVITLDKGATVGQKIRKQEKGYRTQGDIVSLFNKNNARMKTLHNESLQQHSTHETMKHITNPWSYLTSRMKETNDAHAVDQIENSDIAVE